MTLAEYCDEIMFILGGIGEFGVDIEIKDNIDRCVNRAFREVKQYVTTPAYMTVPFGARANSIAWTWKVGASSAAGTFDIIVKDDEGKSVKVQWTVVAE